MPEPSERDPASRYRANLQGEINSASLYRTLAEVEPDERLAGVYGRLAAIEEAHAEFWRKQLSQVGARIPGLSAGWRTRALEWLARRFGPAFVLPTVSALEQSDVAQYDRQAEAVAGGLPADERSHARIVEAVAATSPTGLSGSALARLEGRHRAMGGNALRAAVLGANDGLVSNLSLVMGIAGAASSEQTVLLSGLAGLIAGACSMALGEWLSVNSSRELYQRQIATEAVELATTPDEERQEMQLIYEAKGLSAAEAKALADRLMSNTKTALDTLVREELGIDPEELGGSAITAAATSFLLFAAGAIFPVAPYLFIHGHAALAASLGSSGAALFVIGGATSLLTGRNVLFSGLRQVAIGAAAAAVTYGVGTLLGVAING